MSLLSPDALYVALSPEHVAVLHVRGGLRPRVLARESVAVDAGSSPGAAENWRAALEAIRHAIAGKPLRGTPTYVVLANGFARYRLVPWRSGLRDREEKQALVRHGFARVHGERAERWALRWSEGGASEPAVACAIERNLLAGIEAVAADAGLRLLSVQPYLVTAFNAWRKELRENTAWLVLPERTRVCVALFENGVWRHVAVRALSGTLDEALPVLLDQEAFAAQLPGLAAPVYVHAPAASVPVQRAEGAPVHTLTVADAARFGTGRHRAHALSLFGGDDA